MEQHKTPRKRAANFTTNEKALLAQLIKKNPVIESKLTDGKSVSKKKLAWISVTEQFNSNAHVHKRDVNTLKRAWDNLKAFARKTRATERGYLLKTGGGPSNPSLPPQQGAIISIIEEAAPVMISKVKNQFDSDGMILSSIDNNKENDGLIVNFKNDDDDSDTNCSIVHEDHNIQSRRDSGENIVCDIASQERQNQNIQTEKDFCYREDTEQKRRKPSEAYVRREGVLRIKHFKTKMKIEMQILEAKLETQHIKKRAAEMEEEKNKILLEMAKLELAELKKRLDLQ